MPKPICVKCGTFFKPKTNGVYVLEQMPIGQKQEPGIANNKGWIPYKIWMADLYECHSCGAEIVHGYGFAPQSEHYKDDFKHWQELVTVTVNDC